MIVLDASILIAYLDPRDAHHAAAVDLLAESVGELVVHPITAAEILVHPTRTGVDGAVWQDLAAIGLIVDVAPLDPHQLARLRVTTGCKMPDCCVLATAVNRGGVVLTFDQQLVEAASKLGVLASAPDR